MKKIPKYFNILVLEFLKRIRGSGFYYPIKDPVFNRTKWFTDSKTTNEFLLGLYEPELYELINDNLKKGAVFYDLGAHWGYFSLMSSCIVGDQGQVYAFEPMMSNYQRLDRNVRINNIKNVKLLQLAVSDKSGVVRFSNSDDSYANTYKRANVTSFVEVNSKSLDDLIDEGLRPPDFIKIDVEGAELDVLKGAKNSIKNGKPFIHLSTHDIHVKGIDRNCLEFLDTINYLPKLISSKRGIRDYLCVPK